MTVVKHPVFNNPKGLKPTGTTRPGKTIQFYHVPSNYSIEFKAFITEFSDQFTSNWESEDIYGRMDPIRTFASTQRQITLAFDVVAASAEEAQHNLKNISMLAQFHYPSYDKGMASTTAINQSPLLRVKYMNWICRADRPDGSVETSGLLVASSGFSYSPNLEDLTFEIDGMLYPKFVNVSVTLDVLHEHKLGWEGETGIRKGDEKGSGAESFPYKSSYITQQETYTSAKETELDRQIAAEATQDPVPDLTDLDALANDLTLTDEERAEAIAAKLGVGEPPLGPVR
tara:strand:- start:541 stop:1398 length:858 start_codon:yes stop_codon:yes gene_type:complete